MDGRPLRGRLMCGVSITSNDDARFIDQQPLRHSLVHLMHLSQLLGSCSLQPLHLFLKHQTQHGCNKLSDKTSAQLIQIDRSSRAWRENTCGRLQRTTMLWLSVRRLHETAGWHALACKSIQGYTRAKRLVVVNDNVTLSESSRSSFAAAMCRSRSFSSASRASYSPSSCSAADRCRPSSSFNIWRQHNIAAAAAAAGLEAHM